MTATFQASLLEEKLKGLGRAVRSIRSTALWLSFYPQDAQEIVQVWRTAFLRHSADFLTALNEPAGDAGAQAQAEQVSSSRSLSSSATASLPTYNKCNLLFVAHEVLLLTRKNPGSFALHFSTALPEVLTHCPPDDEVLLYELSRLVAIWAELRIFKPEVLEKLEKVARLPPWGISLSSTSRFPDLVRVSDGIVEVEQARRVAAVTKRKRKWCAVDDAAKRMDDEIRSLEVAAEAVRKLQRTVREVQSRLTDEVMQAGRSAVGTIKSRVNELQAKAAPAATASPTPPPTPPPEHAGSDDGDLSMRDGESPTPEPKAEEEQERVYEKGQRVLYRGRDGQFGAKIMHVDKSIIPFSYQVLLDNGNERFTEASHILPEGTVVLDDLFARITAPQADQADQADGQPDTMWAALIKPAVDAIVDAFSESAASEA